MIMSTKIIMIRHGFSVSNDRKLFTGQTDIELTEKGREQARLCGEFFKTYEPCSASAEELTEKIRDMGIDRVDAIYSSDLSRAYETACEVGKALNMDIQKREGLREIYAGAWELMPFVEIDEKYPEAYAVWKNDIGRAKCTLGDSVSDLAQRIEREVSSLAVEHDGGTIVIVTHATPIRVICTLSEGLDHADMGRVEWVSNASISIFEFDGKFKLIKKNITSHLGDLRTDLPRGV